MGKQPKKDTSTLADKATIKIVNDLLKERGGPINFKVTSLEYESGCRLPDGSKGVWVKSRGKWKCVPD